MKQIIKFLYSSKFLLPFAFIVNVAIYVLFSIYLSNYIYETIIILGMVVAVLFMNKTNENAANKIIWILLFFIVPLFGVALYLNNRSKNGTRQQRKTWKTITYETSKYLEQNLEIVDSLKKSDSGYANVNQYLLNFENMPVYQNSQSHYIASGEDYFKDLFEEIKAAKKYILLEFFVIKPGKVWDELFTLLKSKTFEGVEIRLLYDDFGCLNNFKDKKHFEKLNNHKIESASFNKVQFGFNMFVNYRNHRKLAIIDGKTSYIGGVNVADEYANINKEKGYFKDTAIKISGPAVFNSVVMFFNNWNLATNEAVEVSKYMPTFTEVVPAKNKEFIQPFGTSPLNIEPVAKNLYLKMINTAKDYVYVTSPYLIIDYQMQHSLKLASQSGVDVKIIMPATSDKTYLFYLSRSYYESLIKAGVKIYEYSPGYMHAKMLLLDGYQSLVGTVNFDFRNLFLHFENGVLISNSKTLNSIKYDFDSIINSSHLVSLRDLKQRKWYEKFASQFLKFFAPLV